jgi:imidazolonepropionase-like amidohydrolase
VKIKILLIILCIKTTYSDAQNIAAPKQSVPIAIKGATIHCTGGKIFNNGVIAFENGKITVLEESRNSKIINQDKYEWIDATGKHIYPGLIAINTQLGLSEIEAVRATNDFTEIGAYNPNVRAIIAYNTDSYVIPTVRSNGVLIAQATPTGGVISGSSSVMHLDGWNWEDAVLKTDDAIYMYWPNLSSPPRGGVSNPDEPKPVDQFEKQIKEIRSFFEQASAYSKSPNPEIKNLKFEALKSVFEGNRKIFIRANSVIEIQSAIQFMESFNIKPVIVGGQEAWKICQLLKEKNIPVVFNETHRLPMYEDDNIAQPYKTPVNLALNSILFSISVDGFWQVRNLPFQVGQAIPFGLDKEKALDCVTINAAKILGINEQTGSLEIGKDATLIISDGDIFDIMSNNITHAFIQGKKIDLNNKQKTLNNIYRKKYRLN